MLNEAIGFMLNAKQFEVALDLQLYQVAMLDDLVRNGYDPRPALNVLRRTLTEGKEEESRPSSNFCNLVLIALAELLHNASPVYLPDVLSILKVI